MKEQHKSSFQTSVIKNNCTRPKQDPCIKINSNLIFKYYEYSSYDSKRKWSIAIKLHLHNYSWASKGKKRNCTKDFLKRSSVLIWSIISRDRFISYLNSHNNSDIFIGYIENLVAWLTITQGIDIARVALLIDNSLIHSSKKIIEYLNRIGCKMMLLPPYST